MYLLDSDFCGALADYTFRYRRESADPTPSSSDQATRATPSHGVVSSLRRVSPRILRKWRKEGPAR